MTSKQDILNAIRKHQPAAVEAPSLDSEWITYADKVAQLTDIIEKVGGRCVRVADRSAATVELQSCAPCASAAKKCSLVEGVGESSFNFSEVTDPHTLQDVDFAVLPGEFAVAENGAVWVKVDAPTKRNLYFLAQHIALVVPTDAIVDNMHQAYQRLQLDDGAFGVFISGPSKTADIEQSLVIGAQGPRTLTILLIDTM